MKDIQSIIMKLLPGETDKEKYNNVKKIGSILLDLGWVIKGKKIKSGIELAEMLQKDFVMQDILKMKLG